MQLKASFFTLFLLLASCAQARTKVAVPVGDIVFLCEIALTPEEKQQGLMYRKNLKENEGMLFVFEDEALRSFWMKNTLIPLSIAYIDSSGTIREIYDMQPESLQSVPSLTPVKYALEVNQGAFQRADVDLGDQVVIPEAYR